MVKWNILVPSTPSPTQLSPNERGKKGQKGSTLYPHENSNHLSPH
uniref:Uncharacterized protein n=1 Tax=Rhizophora mucronata TaxID=61149 RepID=A0A2P2NE68_RHIMU